MGANVFAAEASLESDQDDHRRGRRRRATLSAARSIMPGPREDRPGQPVYSIEEPPERWLERPARGDDGGPRPAAAGLRGHPSGGARRRPARARSGLLPPAHGVADREGRSWLWAEDGTILFKAEASAWTPERGPAPAGLGRSRGAQAGLRQRAGSAIFAGCSSSGRLRCACSSAPRTSPRSASTRRSACGGSAPTGACSSEGGCSTSFCLWNRELFGRLSRPTSAGTS